MFSPAGLSPEFALNHPSRVPTRRRRPFPWRALLALFAVLVVTGAGFAQVNVYTRSYDTNRTGANLNETILTPANVNPNTFGKLYSVNTDGQVFAQPLFVSGLTVNGGTHDVVFVATMRNSVYAIDAPTGAVLWQKNFGTPINPSEVQFDQNISWNGGIGILSTPVIDPATNYMYFVTGNESQVNGAAVYAFNLNAIDITTGAPVHGSPVAINPTYQTADNLTPIVFTPKIQNQRTGLGLANGNVYMAFASHDDYGPYQGWIVAYSTSTLAQTGVYVDADDPGGPGLGGIWQAGAAPAIDSNGNVYYSTGNGLYGNTPNNIPLTGNSFIKLSPTLGLQDYFTPFNTYTLNGGDQDLGASGVLLIPNTNYMIGGGKQGVLYLVDSNDMTKYNSAQDNVRQEFQAVYGRGTSHIHSGVTYFDSGVNGQTLFAWGENDVLRQFQFNTTTGMVNPTPLAMSTMTAPVTNNYGSMPGGFTSISASGKTNGILWASTPYNGDAAHYPIQGVLYAFNADTLAPLWTDKTQDARDEVGWFAKYVPPVVANGRMFIPTFGAISNNSSPSAAPSGTGPDGTGQLVVYGLLHTISVTVANATISAGAALPIFTGTVTGIVNGDTGVNVTYSTTATTTSPAGTYPITATISGSSAGNYYQTIVPGTLTINPVTPDFSFSVASGSLTVASGQTGSIAAQVTPVGGLTGTLSLTCAGLPQYASCSLAGGSALSGAATTATVQISTQTTTTSTAAAQSRVSQLRGLAGGFGVLAALLVCLPTRRRPRWLVLLLAAGLLPGGVVLSGCGSSTSAPTTPHTVTENSPAGTYNVTLTLTATGATTVTHTQPLTLIVQ